MNKLVYYIITLVIVIFIILYFCKSKNNKIDNLTYDEYINKNDNLPRVFGDMYLKCTNANSKLPLYFADKYVGNDENGKKRYFMILSPNKNEQSKLWYHFTDAKCIRPQYQKLYHSGLNISYEKYYKLNDIQFVTSSYVNDKSYFLELEPCDDYQFKLKTRQRLDCGTYEYVHISKDNKLYFKEGNNSDTVAKFRFDIVQLK